MRNSARFGGHVLVLLVALLLTGLFSSGCTTTPPVVVVVDGDQDGVPDPADRCPQTPANVKVAADGCVADSDLDGVTDDLDRCPHTPVNMKVAPNGCPADSDGDGIVDNDDKCPDTAKGEVVDATGCVVAKPPPVLPTLVLQLEFLPNQGVILPEFSDNLKKAADLIALHPDHAFWIDGHTDSVGSDAFNVELSLKRAESVRTYLIEQFGFSGNRLLARGFGERKPLVGNETQEGRKQNRRVEILPMKSN